MQSIIFRKLRFWSNSVTYDIREGWTFAKDSFWLAACKKLIKQKNKNIKTPQKSLLCICKVITWFCHLVKCYIIFLSCTSIKFINFFFPKPGWSLKCYGYYFFYMIFYHKGIFGVGFLGLFLVPPNIWAVSYFLSCFCISNFWNFVILLLQYSMIVCLIQGRKVKTWVVYDGSFSLVKIFSYS